MKQISDIQELKNDIFFNFNVNEFSYYMYKVICCIVL